MDAFVLNQASTFFHKFTQRPLMRVIHRVIEKNDIIPNFDQIQEKIDNHAYLTITDFSIDVRSVLEKARLIDVNNNITNLTVVQLRLWFDKHIIKLPRSKEELNFQSLNKIKKNINELRRAMSLSAQRGMKPPEVRGCSSSGFVAAPVLLELQNLISEECDNGEVQRSVATIISRYLPGFRYDGTVTFDSTDISPELADELFKYLTELKNSRSSAQKH